MFARWYCVRYPDSDRPEFVTTYESHDDNTKRERSNDDEEDRSNDDDEEDIEDIQDDDYDKMNEEEEIYADYYPHMMDDQHEWFHLVLIANPIPVGNKKNKDEKKENNKNKKDINEQEEEMHTELRFFINGLPIRKCYYLYLRLIFFVFLLLFPHFSPFTQFIGSTITTRRPMGNIRCVGNSFNGLEPWGAIADFRLYSRAFSIEGGISWPDELNTPPPTFPAIQRPIPDHRSNQFVNVGQIDNVRKWLVERGILHSIVTLLKSHEDQLLERAVATLANIALYSPSIPYLLRQTVSVNHNEYDDKLIREELQHLRDEENMLLLEEIRLRERITTREINVVRDVGETSSQDDGNETEGDKLLLAEFDTRRDQLLSRIQDIVFDEEFRSISRSLPLGIVLSSLAGIHDKPSIEKSIRKQVHRLLVNLR